MGTISIIISVITILYKIISALSESSESSSSSRHNVDTRNDYLDNYEFSENEKLDIMNIDSLVVCYNSTTKIINYSPKNVLQTLTNNSFLNEIIIKDIIVRKNCVYLKVMYGMPFKGGNKCYGSTFSINYMEPNNCVSVYGSNKTNSEEIETFKAISNELITALSK